MFREANRGEVSPLCTPLSKGPKRSNHQRTEATLLSAADGPHVIIVRLIALVHVAGARFHEPRVVRNSRGRRGRPVAV